MHMQTPTHNTKTFAVVGIGASAGGLDALTKLLAQLHADNLQKTSNKTYVIALHMGSASFCPVPEPMAKPVRNK